MEELGLYKKYDVRKISNPSKIIDAIVLEFDDPIARVGILAWAEAMLDEGYSKVFVEIVEKINELDKNKNQ